mmetsp:Transcript_3269/g.7609  ORF Transcript_3269/g.7609 Transcript_3269/m.7609 type:complete len:279 (-) Transcript_3269:144-980(-)
MFRPGRAVTVVLVAALLLLLSSALPGTHAFATVDRRQIMLQAMAQQGRSSAETSMVRTISRTTARGFFNFNKEEEEEEEVEAPRRKWRRRRGRRRPPHRVRGGRVRLQCLHPRRGGTARERRGRSPNADGRGPHPRPHRGTGHGRGGRAGVQRGRTRRGHGRGRGRRGRVHLRRDRVRSRLEAASAQEQAVPRVHLHSPDRRGRRRGRRGRLRHEERQGDPDQRSVHRGDARAHAFPHEVARDRPGAGGYHRADRGGRPTARRELLRHREGRPPLPRP